MTARVRPARPGDRRRVEDLLGRCDLPTAGVAEHFEGFLVAEDDDGGLVGSIGLEDYGEVGLVRSLAVEPSARGGGVGRSLLEALCDGARRRGVRRLYLLTTTAPRYFERWGFVRIASTALDPRLAASEELRGACPDSAIAMLLVLGDEAAASG